ncbi:AI-2E family transporter [Consotaella salsifontis]|uniref:Predicted PurR-regulated permease PerM n=1 Tax=Consotaella salsifontis TaxID=1365950 RepID=A0A1T4L6J7_9HYPH|nr:AI-2E family transporter [Consotaella salsifontis]SJZ50359.1 Predicted PurR-regulated permease PerM [Consotaella salsifontis]
MQNPTNESSDDKTTIVAPAIGLVNNQMFGSGPRWAIVGIFLILFFGALYLAASFILPVVIALLFALVLSPIVRFLRRRLKIWEPISAVVLVVGALLTLLLGFYMLSDPISNIVRDAPRYASAVNEQVDSVRSRLDRLRKAQKTVAGQDETAPAAPASDKPQEVVVQTPGLIDNAASALPQIMASTGFALVFLFFLLASGDLFYQKLVKSMSTLSDKKRALRIAHDIERELSRYLFTITMINAGLGIAVGMALWLVGMPTPLIFGALATLLNYIPYIGAIVGMGIVGVIGLAEFGTLGNALVPVACYLACTTIEGQFVTPMIVGRRLEMNPAAVFLSVAFWGWIWGVTGMFLAVPLMVSVKIFASYIEPIAPLGEFLSAETRPDEEEE